MFYNTYNTFLFSRYVSKIIKSKNVGEIKAPHSPFKSGTCHVIIMYENSFSEYCSVGRRSFFKALRGKIQESICNSDMYYNIMLCGQGMSAY